MKFILIFVMFWFLECKDQSLKQNKQRKRENKYKRVKARDLENHAEITHRHTCNIIWIFEYDYILHS